MSGPRTLFRGIGFFGFSCFFGFPRVFLVFSSGSFYRLLRLPKTQKPRKKTKKTKDSEECLGQGLCSEALVFLVFLFFWFSSSFFGFGSGSFYRLLRLPKTQKPRKNHKKKTKDSEECLGQGLCSEALVFLFFWFSSSFFGFGSGSFYRLLRLPKTQKPRKNHTKKQRILRNVWAKDFVQRHCFFGFPPVFLIFGSGNLTQKRKDWQECVGNTGFKEMWEPIYGMIAFVFLSCVFFLSIPDREISFCQQKWDLIEEKLLLRN